MREYRTSGTVRGAPGNRRSYRETGLTPSLVGQVPADRAKKGGEGIIF